MEALQTAHLQVVSELDELAPVLTWFDQFYHCSISQTAWFQCQLALAEGFTNAVRHAHKLLPPSTPIEIEVLRFAEQINIRIWDSGGGFDLNGALAQLPPAIPPSAEGGRGLKLMQRLVDDISYCRQDNRNCLYLFKRLTADHALSSEPL